MQRRRQPRRAGRSPLGTSGSSENSASASNTSARSSFNGSRLRQRLGPASKASASTGADARQRGDARASSRKTRPCCAGTDAGGGTPRIATSSPERALARSSPGGMAGRCRRARRRWCRGSRTAPPASRRPAPPRRRPRPSALKKRSIRVSHAARLAATGLRSASSGTSAAIAVLRSGRGRRGRCPSRRACGASRRAPSRRTCRAPRRARRPRAAPDRPDRRARLEAVVRCAAGLELEVLQPDRRARPHQQGGVGRERLDLLVELHRDPRVGPAVVAPPRLDLGHAADARAPDAHLEALDQLGGVRHVRLQVVGGDERQARVRVVGRGRPPRS